MGIALQSVLCYHIHLHVVIALAESQHQFVVCLAQRLQELVIVFFEFVLRFAMASVLCRICVFSRIQFVNTMFFHDGFLCLADSEHRVLYHDASQHCLALHLKVELSLCSVGSEQMVFICRCRCPQSCLFAIFLHSFEEV